MTLRMGSLFAGYEGLGLGVSQVLDAELAWVSEIEAAPSAILAHRYPTVPNHGDITAVVPQQAAEAIRHLLTVRVEVAA